MTQLSLGLDEAPKQEKTLALRSFHTQRQPVGLQEALDGERVARRQNHALLNLIREHWNPGERFTAREVHAYLERRCQASGKTCPELTSTRRGITDMADPFNYPGEEPPLVHHPDERVPGPKGRLNSCWSLSASTCKVTK